MGIIHTVQTAGHYRAAAAAAAAPLAVYGAPFELPGGLLLLLHDTPDT